MNPYEEKHSITWLIQYEASKKSSLRPRENSTLILNTNRLVGVVASYGYPGDWEIYIKSWLAAQRQYRSRTGPCGKTKKEREEKKPFQSAIPPASACWLLLFPTP